MAKKSEAKIKFTAETKEIDQSLQSLNEGLKTNRSELRLNAAELKNNAEDADLLQKQHELLSTAIGQSGEKVEVLQTKLDMAGQLLGQNSKEYQQLQRAILAVKTEQQNYITQLKKLESAMDSSEDGVEECGEQLEELGGAFEDASQDALTFADVLNADLAADAIKTGISTIKDGIVNIAGSCLDLAKDSQKGLNSMAASTGMAREEMGDFENVMKDIYNDNFGESMEDVADGMTEVYQASGLTGDALRKTTEDAYALRDTFGYEIPESMRAASSLVNQFGISYDDAMNLIAQGAQNGLDWSDELLDSINEYAPHFVKAGFSAEDMFNIMASGAENGAFNLDKVGDSVKEMMIRVIDGSDSTKEGFKLIGESADEMSAKFAKGGESAEQAFIQTIDALEAIKDPIKQNQAGVDLFGTMWEDMGSKAILALNDVDGEISTTNDALQGINEVKYNDLDSALEGIKRQLETAVSGPIEEKVLPALNDIAQNTDFEQLAEDVGELTENLIEGAGWVAQHKDQLVIIGGVIAAVAGAYTVASTALTVYNTVTGIAAAVSGTAAISVGALTLPFWAVVAAVTAVVAIGAGLILNWDSVKQKAGELAEGVGEFFGGAAERVGEFVSTAGEGISEFVSGMGDSWDDLKEDISSKTDKIYEKASKGFQDLKQTVGDNCTQIGNSVGETWDDIKTGTGDFVHGVGESWSELKKDVSSKADGIKEKTTEGFRKIAQDGSENITNIKETFRSGWESVKTTTGSFVSGMGEKWSELKQDVSDKADNIKENAARKFDKLHDSIKETNLRIKEATSKAFSDVKDGMIEKVDAAKEKVSSIIGKIKGFFNFEWSLPEIKLPKLPKFSISGGFSLNPPSVPSISVSWKAKGGFFNKGPVIVPGLGEAGDEYALPLNRSTLRPLAELLTELQDGMLQNRQISIINNFSGITVREEADINKIADAVDMRLAARIY